MGLSLSPPSADLPQLGGWGEPVCGEDSDQMLPGGGNTGAGVPHGLLLPTAA